jgi:hypothetical protein
MSGFRRERTESRTYAVGVSRANAACLHSAAFTFAALALGDDVEFPSIARRRRFVCTQCGSRTVNVMPDWPDFSAPGNGVPPAGHAKLKSNTPS